MTLSRRGWCSYARAHAADDGNPGALRLLDELELARHGVDGVDDVVILREVELHRRLRRVKRLVGVYDRVRVDLVDALLRHVDLVLPHGLARGENLAVQIRQTHPVIVDEIQRAHAAARQRLHRIAAHAADAEHRHAGAKQPIHAVLPQKQLRS